MVIYILRHGESVGNTKKGFISGRSDKDGLTFRGKIQVIRSTWDLRNKEIEIIYTSPVVRARESSEIVSLLLKLPMVSADWLTELNHGIFENNYWWNVLKKMPSEWDWRTLREDYSSKYPNGESFKDVLNRVVDGISELIKQRRNKNILLVTHNAVISTLLYFCVRKEIPTKDIDRKGFMDFVHNHCIKNAGYVRMGIKQGVIDDCEVIDTFEPIEPESQRVNWYMQGINRNNEAISLENVKTVSSNQDYVIATPKRSFFLKIMNDYFLKEIFHYVQLYTYLYQKKISAPKVLFYDNTKIFFKHETVCYDFLEGKTLDECMRNNKRGLKKTLASVYELTNKIHRLPFHEVKDFWYVKTVNELVPREWRDFMMSAISNARKMIAKKNIKKCEAVLNRLEEYVKNNDQKIPIHGDLSTENIIVVPDASGNCVCKRIIDFELARVGDRLWDFAYFYGWIERIDEYAGRIWREILTKKLSLKDMDIIDWYRTLFHLWTIYDMDENPDNEILRWRGERSREIIESLTLR